MSKRPLPLDSPNWTPLTEVHRFVCEQTGNRRLAAQDLTDAMANDRVRSMRRGVEPPHATSRNANCCRRHSGRRSTI